MRVYIDCEFDGFGGDLISMALVTEDGREWYECCAVNGRKLEPWVWDNVIPVLGKAPTPFSAFLTSLAGFMATLEGCEFIADHPADFTHLCTAMDRMSADQDFRIPIACTMTLLRGSPDIASDVPHNALHDARALKMWHQQAIALPTSNTDARKNILTE
jgi:hypothetical protein